MSSHVVADLPLLRCPVCGAGGLADAEDKVVCPSGHAFNRARQGYLDLLPSGPGHRPDGDTAAMLDARTRVLGAGTFDRVSTALGDAAVAALEWRDPSWDPVVLEVGAGTAHYLGRVLGALDAADLTGGRARSIVTDVSVYAIRRAARAAYGPLALRSDVWSDWPLVDGCVDLTLIVFAPRNADELARVTAPGGGLLVVTPGPVHLAELTAAVGGLGVQPLKQERLAASLTNDFEHLGTRPITYEQLVTPTLAYDALAMGPNAAHLDLIALPTRLGPGDRTVTVDVRLDSFRRRGGSTPRGGRPVPEAADPPSLGDRKPRELRPGSVAP